MRFADLGGVRLAYVMHGDPSDPAILLMRGLGTQLIEWPEAFIDSLVAGGLYVVTFDNRDAGLSTEMAAATGSPPYRLEDMAADVVGLLDHLEIARAHVLGISMGGMIAQHLAFAHPERMLSLISVMSSSGDPELPRAAPEILARLALQARGRDEAIGISTENRALFGSPSYPESEATRRTAAEAAYDRSFRPAGVARQMQAIAHDGSRVERLSHVRVPTLVIHGADDPLLPPAHGEDTARAVPGARLVIVPGMGHNIPEALAPTVARIVLDFISGLSTAAQPPRETH